jgi:hypothetical protein
MRLSTLRPDVGLNWSLWLRAIWPTFVDYHRPKEVADYDTKNRRVAAQGCIPELKRLILQKLSILNRWVMSA